MKPTRRALLAGAGTLFAAVATTPLQAMVKPEEPQAAATGPDAWLANAPQSQYVSQFQWNEQTFLQFVNSNFQVADGHGNKMTLRLLSVQDLRKQNLKSTTAFSLQFQMVNGTPMSQGTYEFSNPQLGKFLMFVVTSAKRKGAPYVAVINRL